MRDKFTSTKEPKNRSEHAVWSAMCAQGWTVIRRGWPDFLCMKDGRILVVEVKPKHKHRLKKEQRLVMRWLQSLGAECYRGDGRGYLILFDDRAEEYKIPEQEFDVELFKRIQQRKRMKAMTTNHTRSVEPDQAGARPVGEYIAELRRAIQ